MAKLTPIERLSSDIEKILTEYKDGVIESTGEVVQKMGKQGAKALRQASPGKKYGSGWTSTIEGDRVQRTAILHNAKLPGLPHLLEHGHVLRNGTKRSFGYGGQVVHIAPIEQQLIDAFEKQIISEVGQQ